MRTLRVAGDKLYPPYEYLDMKGNYRGTNVELMKCLADYKGVKIEFVPMSWDVAQEALKTGEIDVIQGMVYSPERSQDYLFCHPVIANSQVIITPSSPSPIHTYHDLIGLRVAVQEGDINWVYLKQIAGVNLVGYSTQYEAMKALLDGAVDAWAGDELTARLIIKEWKVDPKFNKMQALPPCAYSPVVRQGDYETYELVTDAVCEVLNAGNVFGSIQRQSVALRPVKPALDEGRLLVGGSAAMGRIRDLVDRVKDTDTTLLITGETGCGKEQVVRSIHSLGKRRYGPLEMINCASLPASLIESELFGYEKGAFTNSIKSYPGRFLMADGGILFLDEISEMDLSIQAKLLRVLQDKIVQPLGSTRAKRVDVQIIAASNRNLYQEVRRGKFRQDLYYRLNVLEIKMPPLREHPEDIEELTSHFLQKYGPQYRETCWEPGTLDFLRSYDFPGNVRELENLIERAVVLGATDLITREFFPDYILDPKQDHLDDRVPSVTVQVGESLSDIERKVILHTMGQLKRPIPEVARVLGISERTLRSRLQEYNKRSRW